MRRNFTRQQANPQEHNVAARVLQGVRETAIPALDAVEKLDRETIVDNLEGARFVAMFLLLIFLGGFVASFTPIVSLVRAALGL